jgi:DNA-binding NarL/FixJ family response regulator
VVSTETGASLRVLLPRVSEPERGGATAPAMVLTERVPGEAPASRRIFVVDDDDLFCRTMRRALKPHEVRSVFTASEAEIALLDPAYDPDLVICDLGLPGFGGDILHARIKARRPEIAERFVFVTGGACSKSEADYVRASGCPTMLKPVDTKQLLEGLAGELPPSSVVPESVPTLRSDPPARGVSSTVPTVPPKGKVTSH